MNELKLTKTSYNINAFLGLFYLVVGIIGLFICLFKGINLGIFFSFVCILSGSILLNKNCKPFVIKKDFIIPLKNEKPND